jgi:hypothetical protein
MAKPKPLWAKTIAERMQAIAELEQLPKAPWEHGARTGLNIGLFGSQICLSEGGDFLSLQEAQAALQYWVEQLGGKVTWE